ncbi:MAG: PQQ-dependent sugar dehydrogenase [Pseudomonadota bacterium]
MRRVLTLVLLLSCGPALGQGAQHEQVATGLTFPWAIAFLPTGDFLITERPGTLKRVSPQGDLVPISGVPAVMAAGQGGLLDVVLAPDFADSRRLFLSYSAGEARSNRLQVASARLDGEQLSELTVVFANDVDKNTPHHFAGRMAFLPDGTLLVTVGDGFNGRARAQSTGNVFGTTVRINPDGSVPRDNPFVGEADAKPEIWTYGHRNHQAILVTPDGTVFSHEHGPKGGDELNVIEPGKNYGWPAISYGADYNGAGITPFTEAAGMEQPVVVWTPSIAPAGMAHYSATRFPQWSGDLFVASLAERSLRRIDLDGRTVEGQEVLFTELGLRLRDVRMGPDGYLYVLTDGAAGELLRVSPAN